MWSEVVDIQVSDIAKCERVVYRHGAILLMAIPTTWKTMTRIEMKKREKLWRHSKVKKRSKHGETTNDQTRGDMWMSALL